MDPSRLSALFAQQENVISRAQVLERGGNDRDITRMLRRREWAHIVHVAVARHRRVESRPGIRPVRLLRFEQDVLANLSPPRVRLEQVVLGLAASSMDESAAVAIICGSVQSRRTTPQRLFAALELRPSSGTAHCCGGSSPTSPRAPTPYWSGSTCFAWNARTASPRDNVSATCGSGGRTPIAMSSTSGSTPS